MKELLRRNKKDSSSFLKGFDETNKVNLFGRMRVRLSVIPTLNGPIFNLLFYFLIILYWENVISCGKFNHKSKLYGKFYRFTAIGGSIEMLENG